MATYMEKLLVKKQLHKLWLSNMKEDNAEYYKAQ